MLKQITIALIFILVVLSCASTSTCPPSTNEPPKVPTIKRQQVGSVVRLTFEEVIIPDGMAFYVKLGNGLGEKMIEHVRLDSGTKATLVRKKDSHLQLDPIKDADPHNEEQVEDPNQFIMEYPKNVWTTLKFFQNYYYEVKKADYKCRNIDFNIDMDLDQIIKYGVTERKQDKLLVTIDLWFGWLLGKDNNDAWMKYEFKIAVDFELGANRDRSYERSIEM